MQVYALKLFNFFRFGEKDNSVVFDILPHQREALDDGALTYDELYDRVLANPSDHIKRVKEYGITGLMAVAGVVGDDFDKSNGTGKSSILEAICYLFYDKIVRKTANTDKVEKAGLAVVTNFNGVYPESLKESYVECIFEEKGKTYRIKRGRTFSDSQKTNKPFVEFEAITKDVVDSEAGHRTGDTNEAILQLVNYDYDVFVNSVMFGQNDAGKFLIGTDKIKKEMIVNILHLENVVSGCLEKVRARKNSKEKEVDLLESQLALLQDIVAKHEGIESLEKRVKEAQLNIQTIDKKVVENTKKIEELSKSEEIKKLEDIKVEGRRIQAEQKLKEGQLASQTKEWEGLYSQVEKDYVAVGYNYGKLVEHMGLSLKSIEGFQKDVLAFNLVEAQQNLLKSQKAKSQKDKYTDGLSKRKVDRERLVGNIGEVKSDVSRYQKEVQSLEEQIANVVGDKFTCSKCKSIVSRQHIEDEIQGNHNNIEESNKKLNVFLETKKTWDKEIAKIEDALEQINDWMVKESKTQSAIKEHEYFKGRIKELKEGLEKDAVEEKRLKDQIAALQGQKVEYKSKIESIKKTYEADIQVAKYKLKQLYDKLNDAKGVSEKIQVQIGSLRTDNESKSKEKDDLNAAIGSFNKDAQTITETMSKIKELSKRAGEEKKVFERLLRLDDVFGLDGIQTRIVKRYLPLLNVFIKGFLDILSQGELSVEIYINKSSKVDIGIRGGSASTFVLLSGGEKMLIRLAVDIGLALLSFSRCAQKPEMICLDEIFGPLDDFHVSTVFELLKSLKAKFNRVLIISHKEEINQHLNHKILVEKEAGDFGRSKIRSII